MPKWTFLTNHAQVLLCLAQHRLITTREIGELVGITERSAQRILDDLEAGGYITRHRQGRRNRYEVHPDISMRHPAQQGIAVRNLLAILTGSPTTDERGAHAAENEGESPRPTNRHWRVYGKVQGVGFRAFVQTRARSLGVQGYVRNLSDGSVEIVAQGSQPALNRLERYLAHGPRLAIVNRVEQLSPPSDVTGQGFVIR